MHGLPNSFIVRPAEARATTGSSTSSTSTSNTSKSKSKSLSILCISDCKIEALFDHRRNVCVRPHFSMLCLILKWTPIEKPETRGKRENDMETKRNSNIIIVTVNRLCFRPETQLKIWPKGKNENVLFCCVVMSLCVCGDVARSETYIRLFFYTAPTK